MGADRYLLVPDVVDCERFHQFLDGNAGVRRLRGCKGLRVMRNQEDPEDAFLPFEFDDAEGVSKSKVQSFRGHQRCQDDNVLPAQ